MLPGLPRQRLETLLDPDAVVRELKVLGTQVKVEYDFDGPERSVEPLGRLIGLMDVRKSIDLTGRDEEEMGESKNLLASVSDNQEDEKPQSEQRSPRRVPYSVLITLKGLFAVRLFLDERLGVKYGVVDSEAAPPGRDAWRSRAGVFQGRTDRVNGALARGADVLAGLREGDVSGR